MSILMIFQKIQLTFVYSLYIKKMFSAAAAAVQNRPTSTRNKSMRIKCINIIVFIEFSYNAW